MRSVLVQCVFWAFGGRRVVVPEVGRRLRQLLGGRAIRLERELAELRQRVERVEIEQVVPDVEIVSTTVLELVREIRRGVGELASR